MKAATENVHRLGAAVIGLPILSPQWRERVVLAENAGRIDQYRKAFQAAPLASARAAAQADLLLYVIDEPGDARVPAELDGERPHPVRVGIVDLEKRRPLLRLRRPVDPRWLSDATRAEYARGVDGCALAYDIHEAVTEDRSSFGPE